MKEFFRRMEVIDWMLQIASENILSHPFFHFLSSTISLSHSLQLPFSLTLSGQKRLEEEYGLRIVNRWRESSSNENVPVLDLISLSMSYTSDSFFHYLFEQGRLDRLDKMVERNKVTQTKTQTETQTWTKKIDDECLCCPRWNTFFHTSLQLSLFLFFIFSLSSLSLSLSLCFLFFLLPVKIGNSSTWKSVSLISFCGPENSIT